MDANILKLECLKIAAQEVRDKVGDPKKLIERAEKFFQFVIGGSTSAPREAVDVEPS